jgi:hypothetical protein
MVNGLLEKDTEGIMKNDRIWGYSTSITRLIEQAQKSGLVNSGLTQVTEKLMSLVKPYTDCLEGDLEYFTNFTFFRASGSSRGSNQLFPQSFFENAVVVLKFELNEKFGVGWQNDLEKKATETGTQVYDLILGMAVYLKERAHDKGLFKKEIIDDSCFYSRN